MLRGTCPSNIFYLQKGKVVIQRTSCFRTDLDPMRSSVTLSKTEPAHMQVSLAGHDPAVYIFQNKKFSLSCSTQKTCKTLHKISNKSDSLKIKSSCLSPGGATKFNTGRLRPEVQPLTLLHTILAEKVPLLYTFYWKKVLLSHTFFRKSWSQFHVVLNK